MLRKPEVALVEQFHTVAVVENGGILALLLPVVAAHADVTVLGQGALEIAQLVDEHFLRTEDIGLLKKYLVAHHLQTFRPYIAVQ